jgi:hypothetical protein
VPGLWVLVQYSCCKVRDVGDGMSRRVGRRGKTREGSLLTTHSSGPSLWYTCLQSTLLYFHSQGVSKWKNKARPFLPSYSEETEALRGEVTCSGSHRLQVAEAGLEHRPPVQYSSHRLHPQKVTGQSRCV